MDERDRVEVEPESRVVERHTTVVTSDGGGGGGTLLAVVLLIIVAIVLFFLFGDRLTGGGSTDIKVDVKAPDVELPVVVNGS